MGICWTFRLTSLTQQNTDIIRFPRTTGRFGKVSRWTAQTEANFREDFVGGKERTTWFSPNKIWTNCGDKVLNVDIKAANVSESITPREYADLLFDGIGAALVFNFKRLKREEFDGLKPKIDWSIVESFPFPAPFEEQRYIGDEGEIHVYSWDGRKETTLVGPYSVRELYLEHFGES